MSNPLNTIPYNSQPRRRWPLWLQILVSVLGCFGLIAIAVSALLAYTVWRNGAILGVDLYNIPIPQAQTVGLFSLPPSASNVQSHLMDWQDFILRIRFDMSPDEEQAFLASTFCKPVAKGQGEHLTSWFTGNESWWRPPTAGSIEFFEGDNGNVYQKIMIDRTDPKKLVVYFVAFDT